MRLRESSLLNISKMISNVCSMVQWQMQVFGKSHMRILSCVRYHVLLLLTSIKLIGHEFAKTELSDMPFLRQCFVTNKCFVKRILKNPFTLFTFCENYPLTLHYLE